MKTSKAKPSAVNTLRNDVYDMLVKSLNPRSKFYNQDCEDLWFGLVKKSSAELRDTLNRQRAIANVSDAEMRRHCQA